LARHVRADVIHTNGLKAHLLAGVAGRLIGTPVVWHLRDFPPSGFASRVILIASRWLPALVLANSDAVAASLRSPDSAISRVSRLYNPVDLCRFHPDLPKERIRRELGLNTDVPLVGLIAHLTPWKGHETFLTIARAVTDAVPKARFVVAGGLIYETDGHAGYAETLRQRVLTLGLAGRVIFLGPRNDIPEVLAALDVLVHCPTAPEPFGRVVAEAMAVGCPVVAANSGGIPEIVDNGVTGFLAPPGDTQGFTSAVVQLLKEPALRERFGRAGRQQAEALFSVEAHTAGVLEAYRTLERSNVQTF
jgi:glycosyltransferase involved in cell wall biosynthesis